MTDDTKKPKFDIEAARRDSVKYADDCIERAVRHFEEYGLPVGALCRRMFFTGSSGMIIEKGHLAAAEDIRDYADAVEHAKDLAALRKK